MAVFDLFSKRQKRLKGEQPDVYQYRELPVAFRVQFAHILRDLFGNPFAYESRTEPALRELHDILCREYGVFRLSDKDSYGDALVDWFLKVTEIEKGLDFIELAMQVARTAHTDHRFLHFSKPAMTIAEAEQEVNVRLGEHGIGYRYESSSIMRVDSQIAHAEIVKPALHLLTQKRFAGANDEYLRAHEHYRHGRHREAINECLKAFESVLKVICSAKKWSFKDTDTAKTLLDVAFTNELIPQFLVSEFNGLRSLLESGVPTTRNRTSGHGQGATPKDVPAYVAAFALHATAANILLLVEAAAL